jgi:hypothetical protein
MYVYSVSSVLQWSSSFVRNLDVYEYEATLSHVTADGDITGYIVLRTYQDRCKNDMIS